MAIPLFNMGGLASGLDTNSIILDVERIPINQLEARKADHQAEDRAWQTIEACYSAIRTSLDALDSAYDFDKFATASSSNTAAVGVRTTAAATRAWLLSPSIGLPPITSSHRPPTSQD